MNKDIHIHINYNQWEFLPRWDRTLEQNRFPIQIIEDTEQIKWITLLGNIDFNGATYRNVALYQIGNNSVQERWFKKLMESNSYSHFADGDIIRNPTFEEYINITRTLKEHGIVINKKRNTLTTLTNNFL